MFLSILKKESFYTARLDGLCRGHQLDVLSNIESVYAHLTSWIPAWLNASRMAVFCFSELAAIGERG